MTFNPGQDRAPSWLPDGSGIIYSAEDVTQPLRDRCLAVLPASGGTVLRTVCAASTASADSVDNFGEPSVDPAGRMLFTRYNDPPGSVTPTSGGLMLGTLQQPENAQLIRSVPYADNGTPIFAVSHLRWLSAMRAAYLEATVQYSAPCNRCELDTLPTGVGVILVDLSGAAPVFTTLPGLANVSSIATGATSDRFLYTVNGDSRVFQYDLATGQSTLVHDFGAAGVARDIALLGQRLVAVVGGKVTYLDEPSLGFVQRDAGGVLYLVDLATSAEVAVAAPVTSVGPGVVTTALFRRPAIAPDGTALSAEGFLATIVDCAPPSRAGTQRSREPRTCGWSVFHDCPGGFGSRMAPCEPADRPATRPPR